MKINIAEIPYTKTHLLTTNVGQAVLARAKAEKLRPRCSCCDNKPEMYISRRGIFYYLARMPGSASLHANDCQSHVVPSEIYDNSTSSPEEILRQLWKLASATMPHENRTWVDVRHSLLQSAATLSVDDLPLLPKLLAPELFDRQRAEIQKLAYAKFYQECDDDDGAVRYWTLGIIKDVIPSKFSSRMSILHMAGTPFWVKKEKSARLTVQGNNIHLALLVCRPVPSGIAVSDIATIELTRKFQPVVNIDTPVKSLPSESPSKLADRVSMPKIELSDEDKILKVMAILNLPEATPRRDVITHLIDKFLGLHDAA